MLQLILNAGALVGGAAVWKLYVENLKAASAVKDATVVTVEKSRDFWKEKVEDFEKRSPEVMEKLLAERIQIREGEIARLMADSQTHQTEIAQLQRQKGELETDMVRARGFRLMLSMEDAADEEYEKEHPSTEEPHLSSEIHSLMFAEPKEVEVELVYLGEVAVDSGQLMITDPCYIDSEWIEEPFNMYGPAESSELTKGRQALMRYSYDGASQATMRGGGELAFTLGHPGAGVAFPTAWGDGAYPVYAEQHNGNTVRVFINVG
ncbi:DUF4241 domain-containing protein [Microbacterium foliorum]|uniref:DUF4241 domain-containing protein n=1 Tax=Microbacterium foliorum TaxID=104336 RepID=UPI001E2ED60C|nr:DUF4241 domain-containing protein [Microbacterium foliorum]